MYVSPFSPKPRKSGQNGKLKRGGTVSNRFVSRGERYSSWLLTCFAESAIILLTIEPRVVSSHAMCKFKLLSFCSLLFDKTSKSVPI